MHCKGIYSNYSDAILKTNYYPRKSSCPSAMWQQEHDVIRPIKKKKVIINSLQTTSVGHPIYILLLFFSVFILLTSWTLELYHKRSKTKWNSYISRYWTCFITKTQILALNLPCICWKCVSACPLIFCSRSFCVCHVSKAHMMVPVTSLPRKLSCHAAYLHCL